MKKIIALASATTLSLTALSACGDAQDDIAETTPDAAQSSVADEVATEVEEQPQETYHEDQGLDDDDRDDNDGAAGGAAGAGAGANADLPKEVTGYSDEARGDMAEDGISEADVKRVLAAAQNKEPGVEVEWDDDGYWEIEFEGIDIDIDQYGLVLDADRDD